MVADIYRCFSVTPAELRYVGNCNIVERPYSIFIERLDAFLEANLNAIREQVVLPKEILLLNPILQVGIVFLSD